jgi:hypothetical protein
VRPVPIPGHSFRDIRHVYRTMVNAWFYQKHIKKRQLPCLYATTLA